MPCGGRPRKVAPVVANRLRNPGQARAWRFDTSTFRKEQRTGRRSPARFPAMRCTRTAPPVAPGRAGANTGAGGGRDSRSWRLGRGRRVDVNPTADRVPGESPKVRLLSLPRRPADRNSAPGAPDPQRWRMSDRFQQCGNGASGQPSRKHKGALGAEPRPVQLGSRTALRPYGTLVRLTGHSGRGWRGTQGMITSEITPDRHLGAVAQFAQSAVLKPQRPGVRFPPVPRVAR